MFCGGLLKYYIKKKFFIYLVKSGDKCFVQLVPKSGHCFMVGELHVPTWCWSYKYVRRTHILPGSSIQQARVLQSSGHGQRFHVCEGVERLLLEGKKGSITEIKK